MKEAYTPLGLTFASLTKHYLSLLSFQLEDMPLNRYFYPFWLVAKHSGTIGQQQLGELLNADKVTVVRIIDYLEKEEFVERQVNPNDRRCHLLVATEFGLKHLPKIEDALAHTDKLFFKMLGDDAKIQSLLEHAVHQLKQLPGNRIALYYDNLSNDEA
jgi:MarR family transcriptional regulator, transcriptional regulator for hemolysin